MNKPIEGIINKPIKIELVDTPQGWIARFENDDDFEAGPHPTPHQALEEVAGLLKQFWDAFAVFLDPWEK